MRALVLGATGHIGNAIVRELIARGHEVTATSRRAQPALNLRDLAIEYRHGDADAPGTLEEWIAGHDVVIDAAAPYPVHRFSPTIPAERDPFGYAEARTDRLLDAVRRLGAVLAYVGSFATLPRTGTRWQALGSRTRRSLHPYFAVKELIERRILRAGRGGLRTVIVNPAWCLGPWDLKPREICIVPQVLRREIPISVEQIVNVIDVRDVATGLAAALETGSYGRRLPLSGHNISFHNLAAWICELGGVEPPRLRTPLALGVGTALAAEAVLAVAGRQSPCPTIAMLLISESYPMSASAFQTRIGASPKPLSRTIRDSIDWYRRIGYC